MCAILRIVILGGTVIRLRPFTIMSTPPPRRPQCPFLFCSRVGFDIPAAHRVSLIFLASSRFAPFRRCCREQCAVNTKLYCTCSTAQRPPPTTYVAYSSCGLPHSHSSHRLFCWGFFVSGLIKLSRFPQQALCIHPVGNVTLVGR